MDDAPPGTQEYIMLRQDSIQSAELKKKESPFRAKCHEIFCCPLKQVHLKENTEPEGLWHSGSMFCLFGSSPCVSQACCVSQLRSCPLLACPCLGLPRTLRASPGSPGQSWLLLLSGLFVPALSITHCPFFLAAQSCLLLQHRLPGVLAVTLLELPSAPGLALTRGSACPQHLALHKASA